MSAGTHLSLSPVVAGLSLSLVCLDGEEQVVKQPRIILGKVSVNQSTEKDHPKM